MIECILAFGDSNVVGDELGDRDFFSEWLSLPDKDRSQGRGYRLRKYKDSVTKQYAFPATLGKLLGVPSYNFAMSGGSNPRSIRKLLEQVDRYKNALIIFGYSHYSRTEFYFPHYESMLKDDDHFLQVNAHNPDTKIEKFYLKEYYYPYNNNRQTAMTAQAVADAFGHKIVHINFFDQELNYKLDTLYDFEGQHNFDKWIDFNNFIRLPHGHVEQKGHDALAHSIFKYVKNLTN